MESRACQPAVATAAQTGSRLPNKSVNFRIKSSILSNFQNSIKTLRETSIFTEKYF